MDAEDDDMLDEKLQNYENLTEEEAAGDSDEEIFVEDLIVQERMKRLRKMYIRRFLALGVVGILVMLLTLTAVAPKAILNEYDGPKNGGITEEESPKNVAPMGTGRMTNIDILSK